MKAVSAKDLIVGRVYSDVNCLEDFATLLKYTGESNGFYHFDYVAGHDSYGHGDGGSYARFHIFPKIYGLSPSEIEQYLPK